MEAPDVIRLTRRDSVEDTVSRIERLSVAANGHGDTEAVRAVRAMAERLAALEHLARLAVQLRRAIDQIDNPIDRRPTPALITRAAKAEDAIVEWARAHGRRGRAWASSASRCGSLGSSGTCRTRGWELGPAPGHCFPKRVGGLCGTIVRQKECEGGSLCQVLGLRA